MYIAGDGNRRSPAGAGICSRRCSGMAGRPCIALGKPHVSNTRKIFSREYWHSIRKLAADANSPGISFWGCIHFWVIRNYLENILWREWAAIYGHPSQYLAGKLKLFFRFFIAAGMVTHPCRQRLNYSGPCPAIWNDRQFDSWLSKLECRMDYGRCYFPHISLVRAISFSFKNYQGIFL